MLLASHWQCDESRFHQPLLKWPGGKRKLIRYLLPLLPQKFNSYYEPFLGGGALFFALRPPRAFLSDNNPELIETYRQVRGHPNTVIRKLQALRNSEKDYYLVRDSLPKAPSGRAARMIYLSTLSFNGIHRVNLRGQFNVPYGFKKHLSPCDAEKVRAASVLLRRAQLSTADFEEAVSGAKSGDLIYFDPPYTTAHANNGFVKYNSKIFTWNDQKRLSELARDLARRGCAVFVSNADHSSVRSLYKDFHFLRVMRHSVIAASSKHRRQIAECIFYTPTHAE